MESITGAAAVTAIASVLRSRRGRFATRDMEEQLREAAALLYAASPGLAYAARCAASGTCTTAQLDATLESVLLSGQ